MNSGADRAYKELLIGCGFEKSQRIHVRYKDWQCLTTLDRNPRCEPTVVHDLNITPWPFGDDSFDECHAYEVVEHVTGRQGDEIAFFRFFTEAWRVLKPDGIFAGTVPKWDSIQAFGDPSHSRIINEVTFIFLSQRSYVTGLGKTVMSDYRDIYGADFEVGHISHAGDSLVFALRAFKPPRLA